MGAEDDTVVSKHKKDTVKQTIVETIEAPRLEDINVRDFVAFKESRTIYERKIEEKNEDAAVRIPLTTNRNSIDESILELFVMAKWVDATSLDSITEDQIKACIEKLARVEEKNYDLGSIERDIRNVSMERPRRGVNLEKKVWRLYLKYSTTLKRCGYDKFVETKPKLTVKHVFKRICDKQLKSRMRILLDLRKDDFKNDFHKFVRQLAEEARAIDLQESARRYLEFAEDEDTDDDVVSHRRKNKANGKRDNPKNKGKKAPESGEEDKGKKHDKAPAEGNQNRKRHLLDCLNQKYNGQHFIRDCPNTSEEEKKKLKEAYHESKRHKKEASRDGKVGNISAKNIDDHTSLFSACFYDGAVETVVMADQGSDANVLSPTVLEQLIQADPTLTVTTLKEARTFDNALQSAEPISCRRVVQTTVRLRVRHGSSLSLGNIKWFVANKDLGFAYIGRHVLAAIGLDNRKLLAMACDRYNGRVDVEQEMQKLGTPNEPCAGVPAGSICGILRPAAMQYGSTFHSKGDEGSDFLEDTDVYIDLGQDTPEELDAALRAQMENARATVLSETGCARLAKLLKEYRSVFECGWESPHRPPSMQ